MAQGKPSSYINQLRTLQNRCAHPDAGATILEAEYRELCRYMLGTSSFSAWLTTREEPTGPRVLDVHLSLIRQHHA